MNQTPRSGDFRKSEPIIDEGHLEKSIMYEPKILEMNGLTMDVFDNDLHFDDNLKYNIVYKVSHRELHNESIKYRLFINIAGMTYKTYLGTSGYGYSYGFKTEEYDYAWTNLSPENKDKLFRSIADFFETVYRDNPDIGEIYSSPSEASYSAIDVDKCMSEIIEELEHIKVSNQKRYKELLENRFYAAITYKSPEDLRVYLKDLNKGDLFDKYKDLKGGEFQFSNLKNNNDNNNFASAKKRKDLFKKIWGRYLKYWRIVDLPDRYVEYKFVRSNVNK